MFSIHLMSVLFSNIHTNTYYIQILNVDLWSLTQSFAFFSEHKRQLCRLPRDHQKPNGIISISHCECFSHSESVLHFNACILKKFLTEMRRASGSRLSSRFTWCTLRQKKSSNQYLKFTLITSVTQTLVWPTGK